MGTGYVEAGWLEARRGALRAPGRPGASAGLALPVAPGGAPSFRRRGLRDASRKAGVGLPLRSAAATAALLADPSPHLAKRDTRARSSGAVINPNRNAGRSEPHGGRAGIVADGQRHRRRALRLAQVGVGRRLERVRFGARLLDRRLHGQAVSVRPAVGRPDHLGPLLGFVGDELAKIRLRPCPPLRPGAFSCATFGARRNL